MARLEIQRRQMTPDPVARLSVPFMLFVAVLCASSSCTEPFAGWCGRTRAARPPPTRCPDGQRGPSNATRAKPCVNGAQQLALITSELHEDTAYRRHLFGESRRFHKGQGCAAWMARGVRGTIKVFCAIANPFDRGDPE